MTTKEFAQYANDRPEVCEKLAACATPEEVYAIAAVEGLTDTLEEFTAQVNKMKEAAQMSEEDLERVSAAGTTTSLTFAASGFLLTAVSIIGL